VCVKIRKHNLAYSHDDSVIYAIATECALSVSAQNQKRTRHRSQQRQYPGLTEEALESDGVCQWRLSVDTLPITMLLLRCCAYKVALSEQSRLWRNLNYSRALLAGFKN